MFTSHLYLLITCLSTSSAAVHSCHIGWNAAQHFSRHCCLQGRQSAGRARHALARTPWHTLRCARALLRECTRLGQGCAKIHCTTTRTCTTTIVVQNRWTTPPRERRNELGGVRGITPGKDLRLSCSRKCAASACIVCRRCLPFSSRVRHCSGGADLRPGQVPRCAEGGSWLRSCQAGAFVGGGRRGVASFRR